MRTKCTYLDEQMVAKERFFTAQQLTLKESSEREIQKSEFIIRVKVNIAIHWHFFFLSKCGV